MLLLTSKVDCTVAVMICCSCEGRATTAPRGYHDFSWLIYSVKLFVGGEGRSRAAHGAQPLRNSGFSTKQGCSGLGLRPGRLPAPLGVSREPPRKKSPGTFAVADFSPPPTQSAATDRMRDPAGPNVTRAKVLHHHSNGIAHLWPAPGTPDASKRLR